MTRILLLGLVIVLGAVRTAAGDALLDSLRIPARHPYLMVTAAEVEKAQGLAKRHPWAREAMDELLREARGTAATAMGPLPAKGDTAHWQIAGRLVQVGGRLLPRGRL